MGTRWQVLSHGNQKELNLSIMYMEGSGIEATIMTVPILDGMQVLD